MCEADFGFVTQINRMCITKIVCGFKILLSILDNLCQRPQMITISGFNAESAAL